MSHFHLVYHFPSRTFVNYFPQIYSQNVYFIMRMINMNHFFLRGIIISNMEILLLLFIYILQYVFQFLFLPLCWRFVFTFIEIINLHAIKLIKTKAFIIFWNTNGLIAVCVCGWYRTPVGYQAFLISIMDMEYKMQTKQNKYLFQFATMGNFFLRFMLKRGRVLGAQQCLQSH